MDKNTGTDSEELRAELRRLGAEMRAGFERLDAKGSALVQQIQRFDRRFDVTERQLDTVDTRLTQAQRATERIERRPADRTADRLTLLENRMKLQDTLGESNRKRLDSLEKEVMTLRMRVDDIHAEMRQRFRTLNEQLDPRLR